MNKVQLAIEIIRDHLGDPPWQVASLLIKGKRTLTTLMKEVEMPYEKLRKSLVQLIQHNCLRVVKESNDPEKDTYELDLDSVLMRLRFPIILRQAREAYGDDGVSIASEFLEKGRLTKGEVLEFLRYRFPGVEKDYSVTLAKMISGHWVQRVPEISMADKTEKKNTSDVLDNIGKTGRAAKPKPSASRVVASDAAGDGLEQFLASVADEQKAEAAEEQEAESVNAEEPTAKKQKASEGKAKPRAKKAAQEAPPLIIEEDTETESKRADEAAARDASAPETSLVMYRINYCQFLLAFRNAEIKKYVCQKYKDTAGRIVQTMLEQGQRLNEKHTVTHLPRVTSPMARSFLCDKLDITAERMDSYLTLLMKGHIVSQHAVKRDKEYVVNIQHVIGMLRQQAVGSIVNCKYGQLGSRIVRILLDKKLVEDKQVQEIAMAPQKEVRQTLVEMYKAGYIQLQEVPRTSERKPMETIYLWGVDLPKLHFTLLDVLYKTTRNLRARLMLERRRFSDVSLSDPEHRRRLERLPIIEDYFNSSIVDVDQSAMLFQNF